MQQLLLIRHGIAEDAAPGQPDADRALTARGRERTAAVAADLAGLVERLDRLVSSDLLRARETADLIAEAVAVGEREVFPGLAPGADPGAVYTRLAGDTDVDTIALVGHEPQMNLLLGMALTGEAIGPARFRKAGVALVEFPGPLRPGAGRLAAFLPPALGFRRRGR
ncbi:phosphohistidine phosphatase SixA [Aquisalimonas lutea]|uniref:phosphohistidine phosphatase SixA n=1 Tax=Aquisalimonas lutea TaxID=1327750 RepID=UPI0025B34D3E|nr:phosphohistidine phosphatase SixA [Aquisalimonas lutea]MDN3518617.1 phosphohistidine phosphatase SixA [Aquisalimonas lutea]